MSVKINIDTILRHLTNGDDAIENVSGSTVGEALDELFFRYSELKAELLDGEGKLKRYMDLFINGQSIHPEDLNKTLNDGDEIYLLMAIAGG